MLSESDKVAFHKFFPEKFIQLSSLPASEPFFLAPYTLYLYTWFFHPPSLKLSIFESSSAAFHKFFPRKIYLNKALPRLPCSPRRSGRSYWGGSAFPACPEGRNYRTGLDCLPNEIFTPWNAEPISLGRSIFHRSEAYFIWAKPIPLGWLVNTIRHRNRKARGKWRAKGSPWHIVISIKRITGLEGL